MYADFSEIVWGSNKYLESVKLRAEILRKPLGLKFSRIELEEEKKQHHFIGQVKNKIIAILLLEPKANGIIKMRQVAVHQQYQNQNIGSRLVFFAESFAKESKYGRVILHARKPAIPFYQKLAYQVEGNSFLELGIQHFFMWKEL